MPISWSSGIRAPKSEQIASVVVKLSSMDHSALAMR